MKIGKVRLSHNLLHSLLHLPADVKILAVQQDYTDCREGIFTVALSGEPLPEICASIIAPIKIHYTKEAGAAGSAEKVIASFVEVKS